MLKWLYNVLSEDDFRKLFSAMPIEEWDKLWRKLFLVKQRCMSCNKYLATDITSVYWHFVADVDDLNKGDDIT